MEVAGKTVDTSLAATPNQVYVYRWDGRDTYGRLVQGAQRATISVGYVYDAVYVTPSQLQTETFGQYTIAGVTAIRSRQEIVAWQTQEVILGGFDARTGVGLGGWTLSAHHFYDPGRRLLYLGTGERRGAEALAGTISTFAGTGVAGFSGDGGPATSAQLDFPVGLAVGPDGSLYISEYNNKRIRKVDPQGIITTVAGNGSSAVSGDGGPATQAGLGQVMRLDVASDGTITFGADFVARVRQISPTGIIQTVAGTGTVGFSGDGGPATEANISGHPREAQHGADGSIYFVDGDNHRVRRISPSGKVSTIAGTGTAGFAASDTIAGAARLHFPEALAVGPDGSVYIEDGDNIRVWRITPDGKIKVVLGTGQSGSSGDGSVGTSARIGFQAQGIDVDPGGALYLAEWDWCRIRRLGPDRIVTTVAGTGSCGSAGDGGPATQAQLNRPYDVAVASDGSIYIADGSNNRVRRISPPLPGFSGGDIAVASEDGAQIYQFSASGRHLRTRDARTGATLLTFGYDAAGRLVSMTDAAASVTSVERDTEGRPTAIVAPFGQRTTLAVDGVGYLSTMSEPGGATTELFHSPAGLLDSLADPRGNVHRFAYDSLGRLLRDDDPAGGSKVLTAVETDTSVAVTVTSSLNRKTTYRVIQLPTGYTRREMTDPAGLTTISAQDSAGTLTTTADGTTVRVTQGGDPRWGMLAPVSDSLRVKLPSGLTSTTKAGRRAALANTANPFSLLTLTDSVIVNGQLFRSVFDAGNLRWTSTTPEGRASFTTTDSLGRIRVRRVAGLDSLVYHYGVQSRLDSLQFGGRVTRYSYDSHGRLATQGDPLGRTDSLFYDDDDRLARQVLFGGRTVTFAYDSSSNLVSITPPGQPTHRFVSTAVDLDSLYTAPTVGNGDSTTRYLYNADRQITQVIRPDSQTITFNYDTAGRPSTVLFDRGQLAYGYSPTTGNLTSISAPGGNTLAFTYDGTVPKSITWAGAVGGSVAYTYNNDFRVTSQKVNGSNEALFGYDRDGLIVSAGALGIKRHAQHGMVERDSVGNILAVTTYDPKGRFASYGVTYSGGSLYQSSYTRDSLGRVTELSETIDGTTTVSVFTYDSAGRLFEVRRNGALAATYEFDANGNRSRLSTPNGVVVGSSDAQDRLSSYGLANYHYTSTGELTLKVVGTDTTRYTYDVLGNLTAVRLPDGTLIEYVIDGQNRRVGKKVNGALTSRWLYQDKLRPVAEFNGSGQLVNRFVYGPRSSVPDLIIRGAATYRVIADHLGSVRLVVNVADGSVVQRIDYDEFGRVTANTSQAFQPFGFAGGLFDEQTGLVRFGARDYDAETGRWTAKDPLGFLAGSTNLYSYIDGDPVSLVDPSGLGPRWPDWFTCVVVSFGCLTGSEPGDLGTKMPPQTPTLEPPTGSAPELHWPKRPFNLPDKLRPRPAPPGRPGSGQPGLPDGKLPIRVRPSPFGPLGPVGAGVLGGILLVPLTPTPTGDSGPCPPRALPPNTRPFEESPFGDLS